MATTGLTLNGTALTSGQGLDVTTVVNNLIYGLQAPEHQWQLQQLVLQQQAGVLNQLNGSLQTLLDKVNGVTDAAGAISARTAVSSQNGIVTATADPGTAVGNHTVVVNSLATTGSYYSDSVATSDTPLATGSFSLQVGAGPATTITIDSSNNTLTQLASSINQQNLGVTASVFSDANGARLAIVSNTSGGTGDLTITPSGGLNFTKASTGQNASLTVDSVPISSASNTVTGIVPGLTLNLVSAAPGTQANISVTPDAQSATQAVNDFVTAYNGIVQQLNAQFAYDPTAKASGPLAGDSSARIVQEQLLGAMSFSVSGNGGISSLADLGISMNNDGTLIVDSSKLSNAIQNNYTQVQNFFQTAGGTTGFGNNLASILNNLTDPTQGAFYVDLQGNTSTQNSLQDQISNFELYIADQRQQLTAQYDQISVMLQQLPLLQAQISAQLGFNTGSNGK